LRPSSDSAAEAPLPDASDLRLAIVVSRFNDDITGRLRDGAVEALTVAGAPDDAIEVFEVPGAFELPWAARVAATSGRFDAVICLGCVIRGETYHFEVIANAAAQGVMAVTCDTGVPVTFGVLTTDTTQQALERAAMDRTNKGWEAAAAALDLVHLGRRMAGQDEES
jgi:6,7-dimethyl-8-ribityllumazine synthase